MNENIGKQFSVHIPQENMDQYRAMGEHAKLQHSVESAVAGAPVQLNDHAALKAHLVSGHLMNENHFWRDGTNENHPDMDPIDWDKADRDSQMPAMSHRDLLAQHNDDHAAYPEDPHTTVGNDHFHH